MQLSPHPPYAFSLLLDVLQRFPAPARFRIQDGRYWRAIRAGNHIALCAVDEALQVQVLAQSGAVDEAVLGEHLATVLGTNISLTNFYAYAQAKPDLWQVVQPNYGLPVYRAESLYHALLFVIIEQHISWVAAQRAQRVLVQWAGHFIEYEGQRFYTLPTPSQLAAATVDDLKPLKITFRRMELLIQIGRQIASGELDMAAMERLPAQALYDALLTLKGIGHWTAAVVVSRVQGVFPFVPHNDVALQAAVAAYFHVEKSASATQAVFAQYDEFAGTAAHFTLYKWVRDTYPHITT